MPMLSIDGSEIYYEECGEGYPVLLFAPGFFGITDRALAQQSVPSWCCPGLARPYTCIFSAFSRD